MSHGESHILKGNHKIFEFKKFDSTCPEHNGTSLVGYCGYHNKNYCFRCEHFNENNQKFIEELNNDEIKKYENDMKNNKLILNKIELLFNDYKKIFQESENNFLIYKDYLNKKIKFMNEIINFYKTKKTECDCNFQMKANIINNYFDLSQTKIIIEKNLQTQIKEINNLITLMKSEIGIIKEVDKFKDFKIENMKNIKNLTNNKGNIYCLKTLYDGRLASGDSNSNLIIYNIQTFNPDIIIQNNLGSLFNFIQLKNKFIVCSFYNNYTFSIIKIKNNEYENIQIIRNAHNNFISNILELKNENIITFSYDYIFKIWKLNSNNNKYEKINGFKILMK